jgi:HD-GYP domain-containing protein (c-di-GMP phosphodiesterase class II)
MADDKINTPFDDDELVDRINSNHYIKKVTQLGDTMEVVAGEDILTRTFHKLVASGTKIDSSFYERLVQHKLLKPIDRSLVAADGVSNAQLVGECSSLIHNNMYLKKMFRSNPDLPYQVLRNIHVESALSIKLTIAKEAMPRLYSHSLMVSMMSIYVGMMAKKPLKDMEALATGGLFHDIGELHLNPELQNRDRQLGDEDWHQIYAHPFISYLIMKQFPYYHPKISTIVLDHHEKLDGSGYPRSITKGEINDLGHMLAVAELAAGISEKADSAERMEAILKLNTSQYEREYINYLVDIYKDESFRSDKYESVTIESIDKKVLAIKNSVSEWKTLMGKLNDQQREQNLVHTIDDRLLTLNVRLMDAGFDTTNPDMMYIALGEEQDWLQEANAIAEEALYQISRIVEEIKFRWPNHSDPHKPRTLGEFLANWIDHAENLIDKNSDVLGY